MALVLSHEMIEGVVCGGRDVMSIFWLSTAFLLRFWIPLHLIGVAVCLGWKKGVKVEGMSQTSSSQLLA